MKTKAFNILKIIVFFLILILVFSNKVQASEASVSANDCDVGGEFTVTVNIPQDVSRI